MFGKLLRRKDVVKTPMEQMNSLMQAYEAKQKRVEEKHEQQIRILRETYESKVDAEKHFEKDLSLPTIILEAENGSYPLEYSIVERREKAFKKVVFKRGKQSPNPYEVTVEEYKNVLFLSVTRGLKTHAKDAIITLQYDKIKKIYSEFKWSYACNYVVKHQMRMFLYDVMKHVQEESFHLFQKYISEFKVRELFWSKKHSWRIEYDAEVLTIEQEKEKVLKTMTEEIAWAIAPSRQIIQEQELIEKEAIASREAELLEYQKLLATDKELFRVKFGKDGIDESKQPNINGLNLIDSSANPLLIFNNPKKKLEGLHESEHMVYDQEVALKMKNLYHQATLLMKKKSLLDMQYAYELERLYERDIQEIWKGYVGLNEGKQKSEKDRFTRILLGIEDVLGDLEEKIKRVDDMDYERKMLYMEQAYLSTNPD